MSTGITRAWGHSRWVNTDSTWRSQRPSFTIVRNPWSWMVSQFRFGKKLLTQSNKEVGSDGYYVHWDFTRYIEWLDEQKDKESFLHLNSHRTTCNIQSQKSFIVNEIGQPVVDVLRFEHFDEDTMRYLKLKESLNPRNVTERVHHDYKSYYNVETKAWVQEQFKEDVDHFGFSFDSGATKNYFYEGR